MNIESSSSRADKPMTLGCVEAHQSSDDVWTHHEGSLRLNVNTFQGGTEEITDSDDGSQSRNAEHEVGIFDEGDTLRPDDGCVESIVDVKSPRQYDQAKDVEEGNISKSNQGTMLNNSLTFCKSEGEQPSIGRLSWKKSLEGSFYDILSTSTSRYLIRIFTSNLIADEYILKSGIFSNLFLVKLLKFWGLTFIYFVLTYQSVRSLKFEHDVNYTITNFFLYDGHGVLLDSVVYFYVGRIYSLRGVDSLFPWAIFVFIGAAVPSILSETLFKYSLSTYDIRCRWPTHIFIIAGIILCVASFTIFMHGLSWYRHRIIISRFLQLGFSFVIFVFPIMSDQSFHPHHWFLAWLLGMHANLPKWWSVLTLSFMVSYFIFLPLFLRYCARCSKLALSKTFGSGVTI